MMKYMCNSCDNSLFQHLVLPSGIIGVISTSVFSRHQTNLLRRVLRHRTSSSIISASMPKVKPCTCHSKHGGKIYSVSTFRHTSHASSNVSQHHNFHQIRDSSVSHKASEGLYDAGLPVADGKIIPLNPKSYNYCVKRGVEMLQSGGVVALPTDTVYGIACLAQNPTSINKLYSIKCRDKDKPIAICISQITQIYEWAEVSISSELLSTLLPGPVTLVFKRRRDTLNRHLNPHTHLVGVRIPDHKFIRDLARTEPLALTSANTSNAQSSINIQEFQELWPELDVIFDGGDIGSSDAESDVERTGSTVLDLSIPNTFRVLRKGSGYENTVKKLLSNNLKER